MAARYAFAAHRLLLFGDIAEVADQPETSVGHRDAIDAPFVVLGDATIETELGPLGCDVRLAGHERVPEDADDFIGVVPFPQDVDDLVEIRAR